MKVELIVGGERKELELKGLRGKDVDKLIDNMLKLKDTAEEQMAEAVLEYRRLEKDYACKVSSMTVDELDELDSDDRDKITGYVKAKVEKSLGFTMPSQR